MSYEDAISEHVAVAYAAQSGGKGRDMRRVQYFSCK